MKTEYADEPYWQDLARENGLRLPLTRYPCVSFRILRWIKKVQIPKERLLACSGTTNVRELATLNADWSMRAMAGVILEHRADIMATEIER